MNTPKELLITLLNKETCTYQGLNQITFNLSKDIKASISVSTPTNNVRFRLMVYNATNGYDSSEIELDPIEGNLLLSKFYSLQEKCKNYLWELAFSCVNTGSEIKTFEDVRESLVSGEDEQS